MATFMKLNQHFRGNDTASLSRSFDHRRRARAPLTAIRQGLPLPDKNY
jgi:hypothetical protein